MNTRTGKSSRLLALVLVLVMLLGVLPVSAGAAATGLAETEAVSDMTVAKSVYGWATDKAVKNADNTVSVTMIPAGEAEAKTYTTAIVYGDSNAMTYQEGKNNSEADIIVSRCGKGVFIEVCLNAADEVIDIRRVLQSGLFFDTAEYGGDLTKIGSEVKYRGLEYTDYDGSHGKTGPMTGLSGAMVASGWVLGKTADTIRLGDGNMTTNVFNETYEVAENVKVYEIGNDYVSTEKTLENVPVTAADGEGLIYNTKDRYQAIVVFDSDYTAYETAKVVEIYYFAAPTDATSVLGLVPQSVRITSDVSNEDQGSPSPRGVTVALTSADPITVVDGKMWTVGDIEVNNYLFRGDISNPDDHQLVMFDFGWTAAGYQYWKNIEKVGEDPRDLDELLVSHGHGDHYGDAFDAWEMIVRADGSCKVYETYEDTMGYDIYGFANVKGMFNDAPFRSIVTNWYTMEEWLDLGNGLAMYPILTPGHTQGVASAIFSVTVGEGGMKGARLNATYNEETKVYDQSFSDYEEGDEIYFVYMGGYGINGLTKLSGGFKRPAFVSSLRYLQSVAPNILTQSGVKCDAIYNLPQHTNQYAYGEAYQMMLKYNEDNGTNKPFLAFLNEGTEEVINFCEKRASAMLYTEYADEFRALAGDGKSVDYTFEVHGEEIATIPVTVQDKANQSVEAYGPYKHEGGETIIQIDKDIEILVMHGYNVFQNVGSVPAGEYTSVYGHDLNAGFSFAKDGNTHDPDKWYVQIGAHVLDAYDGNVYSNKGYNAGIDFGSNSGPVDSIHGEGWSEIIRTEAMTKAEAEALAASLENGAYYKVNLKKTGDINNADDVMDTFVKVSTPSSGGSGGTSKPSINEDAEKPDKPVETGLPFTDVNGHWAKDAIKYVYENKIMNGMTATTFAPETSTTRGMIVTMLYRLAGSPAVSGDCQFADVKSGSYYEKAIIWAAANGIVKGMSETSFAPDASITREQLATMLCNYAKFAKYDVTGSADLSSYADAGKVSTWAADGLKWAVAEKLVNGVGNNSLDPAGDATRAQVATIFQRFMEGATK